MLEIFRNSRRERPVDFSSLVVMSHREVELVGVHHDSGSDFLSTTE